MLAKFHCAVVAFFVLFGAPAHAADAKVVNPFSDSNDRKVFYTTHEGGGVIPSMWYKNMYVKDSITGDVTEKPFAELIGNYGFITNSPEPGGYPIGLTEGRLDHLLRTRVVGVNCAGCHTREFETQIGGEWKPFRVNGAPGLVDVRKFALDVVASAEWTIKNPFRFIAMWTRSKQLREESADFVKSFYESGSTPPPESLVVTEAIEEVFDREREYVEQQYEERGIEFLFEEETEADFYESSLPWLEDMLDLTEKRIHELAPERFDPNATEDSEVRLSNFFSNLGGTVRMFRKQLKFFQLFTSIEIATREGVGRLEAFGTVRNLLFNKESQAAGIVLDAPASIPHIWDLHKHDLLHWNSNSNSVLQRNIAQALGVGAVSLKGGRTNVNLHNLHELELRAMRIPPPRWENAFGPLDQDADAFVKGKALFEQRCLDCHYGKATSRTGGQYTYYDMPLNEIGTDPAYALSFSKPVGTKPFYKAIQEASDSIEEWYFEHNEVDADTQHAWRGGDHRMPVVWRDPIETDPNAGAYPARHLTGTWATGPYLHNNSVPTLRDLLKPADQRPERFLLDARRFDSRNVGMMYKAYSDNEAPTDEERNSGRYFDTAETGNRNTGHDYGTDLSDEDAYALIEYIKSL